VPFLGVEIRAGEVNRTRVPIGEFLDSSPITLPVMTIGGAHSGPTVYVQSGLHGDEQTGIEIVRRATASLDPKQMRGNLVVVPVANIPAHLTRTRGFLHEERWLIDINRIFPGNPDGLLTERIAAILLEEFVAAVDLTLDVHSALDGCTMLPNVKVDPSDDQTGTLALRERAATAFGTKRIHHRARGAKLGTSDMARTLKTQADARGYPVASAEMGESRRASPEFVPLGVRGVHNVLKCMDMLDGDIERDAEPQPFSNVSVVHAAHGGGLRLDVELDQEVRAGETLGEVVDIFGQRTEDIVSPVDGFVLRKMLLGAINTGAEVLWIAN